MVTPAALREAAFWLAVALVSIASSVLVKIIAARTRSEGLQTFAFNA